MKTKIWWALASIAGVLVLSSVISVIEYKRVSTSVSALIANDVEGLRIIKNLESKTEEYNLNLLEVLDGHDSSDVTTPRLVNEGKDRIESYVFALSSSVDVDTLMQSFNACVNASKAMSATFTEHADSLKSWYFTEFSPLYDSFKEEVIHVDETLYQKLKTHSESYQEAFYRSIVPGIVAVGSGLVLVLLFGYFVLSYYVHPIYRMLTSLEAYKKLGRKYNCKFEGDDQLAQLNEEITDIVEENSTLRKRLKSCQTTRHESRQTDAE